MHQIVTSRVWLFSLLVLSLAGCASGSVFTPYPLQMQTTKAELSQGKYTEAQKRLDHFRHDSDRILYLMERGRVSQLGGDIPGSIEDFRDVIQAMEKNEDRATLSLTGIGAKGSALFTNDNAIPYTGEAYERIFVHQFQAINFLLQANPEAALVEVRRANEQQALALEAHNREIEELEDEAREYRDDNPDFMDAFRAMEDVAARVKSSFQNAYSFYTSGLIYEIMGELNDAYIDYKKALEIVPDNHYVQADVLRLARRLQMTDDLEFYEKRYGNGLISSGESTPTREQGEIIVLFEQGFVPARLETKIGLFGGRHLYHVAFPYYPGVWQSPQPLSIGVDSGQSLGQTEAIVSVQALAVKSLQEDLPGMMLRQVLRLATKREVSEQTRKNAGLAGQIVVEILNAVTENADRRSWLTLPNNAQILRAPLAEGEYQLRLGGGIYADAIRTRVEAGRKTVIRIVETGGYYHTRVMVL